MIRKILIVLAVVVVAFVVIVATRPSEFRVSRSETIAAPPSVVFDHVNELHLWPAWSPFLKLDPNMKMTYSGPPSGVGAVSSWAGNDQAGEGSMTIVESKPGEVVRFRLDFVKPFKGTNEAEFTFKPQGNDTVVTWSMSGKNGFLFKAISLFCNMDKALGSVFSEGLANLKKVSETGKNP